MKRELDWFEFSKITYEARKQHGAAFSRNLRKNKLPIKLQVIENQS